MENINIYLQIYDLVSTDLMHLSIPFYVTLQIINQKSKPMKKIIAMAIIAMFYISSALAQASDEKPAMVAETMYILPKPGMEENFEAAVKTYDLMDTRIHFEEEGFFA
jgi:hypothetical protein